MYHVVQELVTCLLTGNKRTHVQIQGSFNELISVPNALLATTLNALSNYHANKNIKTKQLSIISK